MMVDKSHNEVCHAFMQQLPSDWVKIVGFNNKSKYTVAFNLFYFLQPGTNPLQTKECWRENRRFIIKMDGGFTG